MGKLTVPIESGNSDSDSENADVESEEASDEEEPSEEDLDDDESQEVDLDEEVVEDDEESSGPNEATSCKLEVDGIAACEVDPDEEESSEEPNELVPQEVIPNEAVTCGSPREEACSGEQDESSEEEQYEEDEHCDGDATNEGPYGEDVEESCEEAEPSEEEPDDEEPIEEETDEEPVEEELEEKSLVEEELEEESLVEEELEEEEQSADPDTDPDEEPSEGEPSEGSPVHRSSSKNNYNSQANLGRMSIPSNIVSEPKGASELSGIPNSSNEKLVPEKLPSATITGRKRRSRWDVVDEAKELAQDGGGTTVEKGKTRGRKRSKKKNRWSRWSNDDSQLSTASSLKNPAAGIDPEASKLQVQIFQITNQLQSGVVEDQPESQRSPSPPPLYDSLGIRINSREARLRSRLIKQRQTLIQELMKKNPNYKPPSYYKTTKLQKRIKIPSDEYPGYNFVGLIIGPRGNTQKKMEKETGARIAIRGKGSTLEGKSRKPDPHDHEDSHVLVEADDQYSLDAAVAMVKKLLVPVDDGHNEHKLAQLRELAMLKGTLVDKDMFAFRTPDPCNICGNGKHPTSSCPLTAPASGPSSNSYQANFFGEIRGGISPFGGPSRPAPAISPTSNSIAPVSNPKKDIDDAKLFVGQLPQFVNENKLTELFGTFGRLCETKVIRDRVTGLSKGYGFVKYTDHVHAANAVAKMNGYKIEGKMLSVRIAGIGPPSQLPAYTGPPNFPQKNQLPTYPGPPNVPQKNQLPTYPGPPNVPRKIPGIGQPSVNQLPAYPGPPNVPQNIPDQMHWPGPPESRLPESVPSFSTTSSLPPYETPFNRQYSTSVAPSCPPPAASSLFSGDFVTADELSHFPGYLKSLDPPAQSNHRSTSSSSFSSSSEFHFSQNYGGYHMPPTR